MAYHCNDCSYTRDSVFPDGKCPACGSYKIAGKNPITEQNQNPRYKNLRLAAGLGLWVYLFYLLYDKLIA